MVRFFKDQRTTPSFSPNGGAFFEAAFFFQRNEEKEHFVGNLFVSAPYNKAYHAYNTKRASEEESSWRRQLTESDGRSLNPLATWFLGDPAEGVNKPEEFIRKIMDDGRSFESVELVRNARQWELSGRVEGADLPFLFIIYDEQLADEVADLIKNNER